VKGNLDKEKDYIIIRFKKRVKKGEENNVTARYC
jgi:hypothetical protein